MNEILTLEQFNNKFGLSIDLYSLYEYCKSIKINFVFSTNYNSTFILQNTLQECLDYHNIKNFLVIEDFSKRLFFVIDTKDYSVIDKIYKLQKLKSFI